MKIIFFLILHRMRRPLILLITVYAVAVLGLVLIPGQDANGQPWDMDFFHAFYFVSFMGSTIGFGELPYPFTDGQRMWTLFSIYASVTTWLYTIGSMLSLIQEPAFRQAVTRTIFIHAVKRIREPFYLICGYGDTGSKLVSALAEYNTRSVVIGDDQERLNELELGITHLFVPAFCADASDPAILADAGLNNRYCKGLIALTNNDNANLKIAITGKLLNPALPVISRSDNHDIGTNIASFGTEYIINPYESFANRLAIALQSPAIYLLDQWLTGVPGSTLTDPVFPPKGNWILCGFGRFGKAVYRKLTDENINVQVVEADPDTTHPPAGTVIDRGTEAETLLQAGIKDAAGIVAGTDVDANNLSIIITAKMLNPELFCVARQNDQENQPIFQQAGLQLITQRSEIIARKILSLLQNPLLTAFLITIRHQEAAWADQLLSKICTVTDDLVPVNWMISIDETTSPAICQRLRAGDVLELNILQCDPQHRETQLPCLPLMLRRNHHNTLTPEPTTNLKVGDEILFCGRSLGKKQMQWTQNVDEYLNYVLTGKPRPTIRLLSRFKRNPSTDSTLPRPQVR